MSQTPKRPQQDVTGYIHNVSQLIEASKTGKRYFTATLQEAEKFSPVMVFTPQHHGQYVAAETDRSPIALENVNFGQSQQSPGEMAVFINQRSRMSCIRHLDFPFDPTHQSTPIQWKTLMSIIMDPRDRQKVNVAMMVAEEREHGVARVLSNNREMPKVVYAVADHTASLLLTVWGDIRITVGQWYKFNNLAVRIYRDQVGLTTTKQTHVAPAAETGVAVATVKDDIVHLVGEVIGADVKLDYFCPQKHQLSQFNPNAFICRCATCSLTYKVSKVVSVARATLTVETDDTVHHRVTVEDHLLRQLAFFNAQPTIDTDALVVHLLSQNPTHLTCRDGRAITLTYPSETQRGPTSAAASLPTATRELTDPATMATAPATPSNSDPNPSTLERTSDTLAGSSTTLPAISPLPTAKPCTRQKARPTITDE